VSSSFPSSLWLSSLSLSLERPSFFSLGASPSDDQSPDTSWESSYEGTLADTRFCYKKTDGRTS